MCLDLACMFVYSLTYQQEELVDYLKIRFWTHSVNSCLFITPLSLHEYINRDMLDSKVRQEDEFDKYAMSL